MLTNSNNDKQIIKFFTFELYHAKKNVGGTRIRVHNLISKWPNASLYHYGDYADVLIFQKVYMTYDFRLHESWPTIKILDVCDPDWLNNADVRIKETFDIMDAIVCPTEPFAEYIRTFTDTPVRVIKDRFITEEFPAPKVHTGKADTVVWFGYGHNAETIKFAIPSLEKRDIKLIVISNEDPACYRWANSPNSFRENYTYIKFNQQTLYENIQKADLCLMIDGTRPLDRYKSENKKIIAQLCGIPVIKTAEELEAMYDPEARNKAIESVYDKIKQQYDVSNSVEEYKELIGEIKAKRNKAQS